MFRIVYEMYTERLFNYALSLLRSREDSLDLVQEVFVRLWEYRDRISDDKPLEALVFSIGKNLIASAYRRRLTSHHYEEYTEYLDEIASTASAASPMEYDEYRRYLARAIQALPLRQRQIVRLAKWKGMKNSEIARALNLSEQTVKNQLSLGLKGLKLSLAKYPMAIMAPLLNFTIQYVSISIL